MSVPTKTKFFFEQYEPNQYTDWKPLIVMSFGYINYSHILEHYVFSSNSKYAIKSFCKKFRIPKQVKLQ